MPKVFLTEADRQLDRNLKTLHGRLLAEKITNKDISQWLHCTPQNVGYLWRTNGFTYKQILTIELELERYQNSHNS